MPTTKIPLSLPFNGSPEENGTFYHAIQHAVHQEYSCEQILKVLRLPPSLLIEHPTETILHMEALSDCIILTTPNGKAFISSHDQYQTENQLPWRISQASAEHPMFSMAPLPVQLDAETVCNLPLNWLQPSSTLLRATELNKLTEHLHVPSDFWDQKYGTFALLSELYRFCVDWHPEVSRVGVHLGYFPPDTPSYDYTACIPLQVLFNHDLTPNIHLPTPLDLQSHLVGPAVDIHVLNQLFLLNPHWQTTDRRSTDAGISPKPFSLLRAWLQWNTLLFAPVLPTDPNRDQSRYTDHSRLLQLATLTAHLSPTATYVQRFDTICSTLQSAYTAEQLLQLSC